MKSYGNSDYSNNYISGSRDYFNKYSAYDVTQKSPSKNL